MYAKLDEALHSSSAHVREGIADEVYLFYESALNKKCRNHIEYDLDEPEEASKCGVKYVATVKGGTKDWAMFFAYSVDVRFRDGHELDEGDMKKAEMDLKRVFRDDDDLN